MTPEGKVKAAIQDALRDLGELVIRTNPGRVKVRRGWVHGPPEGTADLLVVTRPRGVVLGLEVKQPGEKATAVQLAWGRDLEARGGRYAVVDSLDAALVALRGVAKGAA